MRTMAHFKNIANTTYYTYHRNRKYEHSKVNLILKRLLDIIVSGLLLVLLSPFFVIIALAIVLDSPGSVFFKQKRLGKNLQPFVIYKFRTMAQGTEKIFNKCEVLLSDPRVTTVGKFLRRTKIDELPQLINIFKGDMSLVGPRPMLPRHKKLYKGYRRDRFMVRPGLTGLAQISGGIFIPVDDRVEYDLNYIRDFNILLDIKILLKTIPVVFLGEKKFLKPYPQQQQSVPSVQIQSNAEKRESIA